MRTELFARLQPGAPGIAAQNSSTSNEDLASAKVADVLGKPHGDFLTTVTGFITKLILAMNSSF